MACSRSVAVACVVAVAMALLAGGAEGTKASDEGSCHYAGSYTDPDGTTTTKEFDLSPLRIDPGANPTDRSNNWVVKDYKTTGELLYSYLINICDSVNGYPNASIAQVSSDEKDSWVVGKWGPSDEQVDFYNDGDLQVVFPNGDHSDHKCKDFRQGIIFFVCADVGLGHPVHTAESKACEYFFFWNTCAACPVGSPIRNACPGTASTCLVKTSLSTGAVLLIVFFVLLSFYLIVGALYKRFVSGAKGMDQIPNQEFWGGLWSLAADGCLFVFKCGKTPKKASVTYQNLEHQGLDGLDDEDDDLYE